MDCFFQAPVQICSLHISPFVPSIHLLSSQFLSNIVIRYSSLNRVLCDGSNLSHKQLWFLTSTQFKYSI